MYAFTLNIYLYFYFYLIAPTRGITFQNATFLSSSKFFESMFQKCQKCFPKPIHSLGLR